MIDALIKIPQYWYTLVIVALTAIAAFIPLTGKKLRDGRGKRSLLRGYTSAGRWVVILTAFVAITTFLKDYSSDKLSNLKDYKNRISVDSMYKSSEMKADARVKESNSNIINTFASALAVYGLKYDSTSKELTKRLDTATRPTNNYYGLDPELGISNIVEKLDSNKNVIQYTLTATSKNKKSYNVKIFVRLFTENKSGKIYLDNHFIVFDGIIMPTDLSATGIVDVANYDGLSCVYFYVTGTYEDLNNKNYLISDYFVFKRNINGFGPVIDIKKQALKHLLSSRGLEQ